MFRRWCYPTVLLAIALVVQTVWANPLQGIGSLTEEKVTEILYLEANQLVKGFTAEFPQTLAAMQNNPLNNKMDALKTLLNDQDFKAIMVGVALETLKTADVETIINDTERDFYMSAEDAVEYGLVDKVLEAPDK